MLSEIIDRVKAIGEPTGVELIKKYMMAIPAGYRASQKYIIKIDEKFKYK